MESRGSRLMDRTPHAPRCSLGSPGDVGSMPASLKMEALQRFHLGSITHCSNMMICGCHCCRTYCYDECVITSQERHTGRDLIKAKHQGDGQYRWGRGVSKAKGRWVKICTGCRDFVLTE